MIETIIKDLKTQINLIKGYNDSMDNKSFGYETGVLLTGNDAELLIAKLSERQTPTEAKQDPDSKVLHIADVRQQSELLLSAICQFTKRNKQSEIQEVEKWIETDYRK